MSIAIATLGMFKPNNVRDSGGVIVVDEEVKKPNIFVKHVEIKKSNKEFNAENLIIIKSVK